MKERPTNGQVIIVFTEHPILGILLIPYIAEKLDDGTLQLVEQAFHASPEAMSKMRCIVKLLFMVLPLKSLTILSFL